MSFIVNQIYFILIVCWTKEAVSRLHLGLCFITMSSFHRFTIRYIEQNLKKRKGIISCGSKKVASGLPPLYDDIAESVAAVARRRGPAHVHNQVELIFIGPFDEDAHEEDVPRAEHHLALPVRLPVGGVLVQGHLGDEVSLLGRQGEVNHAAAKIKKGGGSGVI